MDMAGLSVVPVSTPAVIAVRNYADLVSPTLSRFTFDLNSGTVILIPRITLQSDDMF